MFFAIGCVRSDPIRRSFEADAALKSWSSPMSIIESCVRTEDGVCDSDSGFGTVRSHRRSSSLLSFSSGLMIDGLSRKSFSYGKLPPEPIKLSILKLDGSSFDIHVMGTATVKELKESVEDAFSHIPTSGPGKISWPHVWGHFCLAYGGQKILTETDLIMNYGIKDGDQLHIVRHVSSNHVMEKKPSSKRLSTSKQRRKSLSRSSSNEEVEVHRMGDENDDGDLEKGKGELCEKSEDMLGHWELGLAQFLRGWQSSCSHPPIEEGRRPKEGSDRSSRCTQASRCRFWKFKVVCTERDPIIDSIQREKRR